MVRQIVDEAVDTILQGMQKLQYQNNKRLNKLEKRQKQLEKGQDRLKRDQEKNTAFLSKL